MADIAGKVAQIRQAIHGQEVRESLASGIEDINAEVEDTTTRQGKVEQDFTDIKASEADRVQSESTRKENEENRVSNENTRGTAENTRIVNEEIRKENETSRQEFINALKVCEPYDSNKTYVMYNKVTCQGSTYQCIVENVHGVTPGTDNTKWLLIAIKGQDGTGGDMYKLYYDPNGDGVIDIADNSNKLGGNTPDYYEKKGEIDGIIVDTTNAEVNNILKYDKAKNILKLLPMDYMIDNIPPAPINNFVAIAGDNRVTLNWANPTDTDLAGIKIIRKEGSYPTSTEDGILIYNGANTQYVDTAVLNDITYYYRAFPYDTSQNYNIAEEGQESTATPSSYKGSGVKIDATNSNPETAVTYTDDAVNMTGGSSDWDNKFPFNVIKPCLLKAGVVQYYLNPNDFTKKEDGTDADITSGADGDVMIEIPKMAYAICYEDTDLYVKITDNPDAKSIDSRFCYYAHTRDSEGDRDKLYVGAYLGNVTGGATLRSLSGKAPTSAQTIGSFRTYAQANGAGYDLLSFYPLTLLQCLYLIRYKNLDSQLALGRGYVDGNAATVNTGGTNQKGMNFGETTGTLQMKFCGIEDLWGNLFQWIDGLFSNSSRHILTAFKSFNDTGNNYMDRGQGAVANISGCLSKVQGNSETGFIAKEVNGSGTTYFTSWVNLSASCMPIFGGNYKDGNNAGMFRLDINYTSSQELTNANARLMYL